MSESFPLSPDQDANATTEAARYLALANTYWTSAQRLREDLEQGDQSPFYLLASHSIELSLKAVLLSQGYGIERVMMIGHNLDVCLRAAVRRGLAEPSTRLTRTLDMLGVAHGAQAFRYPHYMSWSLPDPDETMGAATRILRLAGDHLAA